MAKWRLTDNHYLNGHYPGEEKTLWERVETNIATGRAMRKQLEVPAYLDKDTIVCQGERHPQHFEFVGPPTPEMEPLDDEAEAISEKHRKNWIHPIEGLPSTGGGFNEALLEKFAAQLGEMMNRQPLTAQAPAAVGMVSRAEFELLQAQMLEMQAQLLKAGHPIDTEEPLDEVEPTAEELAASEAKATPSLERRA